MKNKVGIIMSVSDKGIVALGKDGVFYRLPKQEGIPFIGEEIEIPFSYGVLEENESPKIHRIDFTKFNKKIRLFGLVAAILLFFVVGALTFPLTPEAAYVVVVDINPSLEMYMDEQDKVTKVLPLNEDARELLSNLDLKGKPLSLALKEISELAEDVGLLDSPEGHMIATIVRWNEGYQEDQLQEKVEEELGKVESVAPILVAMSDKKTLKEARKENLSVSKYRIVQELEKSGVSISKATLEKESVDDLMEKYHIGKQELFDGKVMKITDDERKEHENREKEAKKELKNREKELEKQEKERDKELKKQEKEQVKLEKENESKGNNKDKNDKKLIEEENKGQSKKEGKEESSKEIKGTVINKPQNKDQQGNSKENKEDKEKAKNKDQENAQNRDSRKEKEKEVNGKKPESSRYIKYRDEKESPKKGNGGKKNKEKQGENGKGKGKE